MTTGMYPEADTWNPFVGCYHNCIYCKPSFQNQQKRPAGNSKVRQGSKGPSASIGSKGGCYLCSTFEPHYHPERLKTQNIPSNPIVFVFGAGDITYCQSSYVRRTFDVINKHNKRKRKDKTYYFQSKNPKCLSQYIGEYPEGTILLTTLETNRDSGYRRISNAPLPSLRFKDFDNLDFPRKVVTIEPVIDFDTKDFADWIIHLHGKGTLEYVWFGFNSKRKQIQLPEPSRSKAQDFVDILKSNGIVVKGKKLLGVVI